MDSKDMPLSLYGWRPSWIWPKKMVKGVEKFEPYDFLIIWSQMMQHPPLTQFGQTNLANSIFVTSQPPLYSLASYSRIWGWRIWCTRGMRVTVACGNRARSSMTKLMAVPLTALLTVPQPAPLTAFKTLGLTIYMDSCCCWNIFRENLSWREYRHNAVSAPQPPLYQKPRTV